MNTRNIAIDFDIHKKLEAERRGFDETDNEVLRRILGLPKQTPREASTEVRSGDGLKLLLSGSWRRRGVELPEGTLLLLEYQEISANGEIRNREWIVNGNVFHSPSEAACHVVSQHRGRTISINGWKYWKVRKPNDKRWALLDSLRDKKEIHRRHRN